MDEKRVKERRDQIAAIPKNSEAQSALCARVVAYLDEALSSPSPDLSALWAECDRAMESRLGDCAWYPPGTQHVTCIIESAPDDIVTVDDVTKPVTEAKVVDVSPRTGKPKRKYTRRKKSK